MTKAQEFLDKSREEKKKRPQKQALGYKCAGYISKVGR